MEKKLDGNYTRMLRAILNKSWRQHPTKQQLYGHLPPITKTVKVRCTRHVGHYWRSRDELISDILLWAPSHGRPKAGQPARTYIQHLCAYTGCSLEDLLEAMDNREGLWERVRVIRASGTIWWWWCIYIYIYIYIQYIYIYIYICMYTYVHLYILYKYVSLTDKDKFCLYNLFKILLSFLISVLVSGWNW